MISETLLIEFIDVCIQSLFLTLHLKLDDQAKKIYIASSLAFICRTIGSILYPNITLFSLIGMLLMYLYFLKEKKDRAFDLLIVMSGYYLASIFAGALLSFIKIDSMLSYYVFHIVSKLLQVFLSLGIYLFSKKDNMTLKLREYWLMSICVLCIIVALTQCYDMLRFEFYTRESIRFIIYVLILMTVVFFGVVLLLNKTNKEYIENMKSLQTYQYHQQQYKTAKYMKRETDLLNHQMFYILWKIENLAKDNQLEEIIETVQEYKEKITNRHYVISTGNDIFDTFMTHALSRLKDNDIDIKVSIHISKNMFYDNIGFILSLIKILDSIHKQKAVSMSMQERNGYLMIEFIQENKEFVAIHHQLAYQYQGICKVEKCGNDYISKTVIQLEGVNDYE